TFLHKIVTNLIIYVIFYLGRRVTMSYPVEAVAKWFLSRKSMSPKKLQKMLYYAYVWVLTLLNESADDLNNRLFEEKFEAWVHGPVIYSVYDQYREWGFSDIPQYEGEVPKFADEVE